MRFNQLKQQIEAALEAAEHTPAAGTPAAKTAAGIDITLPGTVRTPGIAHPLLKTMQEIVQVFHHLGYSTNTGPQVESDFFNFEALNFPPNHPARDTQDTLVIAHQQGRPNRDRLLMRTHTSPVQIRTMIEQAPPVRIVIPGKVHRNDAADATHSPIFHQVEGLCVDTNITFSDLKGTLDHAMKALFGSAVKTRFFPSFFPFTEPSADVQISCIFCAGKGCRKCKHSGWIELLGCGMVDPAVFAAVDERRIANGLAPAYDFAKISGFAFGMGVERIAMIQHGISDIGHFYSGDMRFLEQFA
jgi:phenylalanyl-tRNA synthetase alpha chain